MNMRFIPTFVRTTIFDNVEKYIIKNISLLLYYPPSYKFLNIEKFLMDEKIVDHVLDVDEWILKYHSGDLDHLFENIIREVKSGVAYISSIEKFLDAYPKSRDSFIKFFITLKNMRVILGTSNKALYELLKKAGYASIVLNELGLSETINMFGNKAKITKDILDLSEGNLAIIKLLSEGGFKDEFIKGIILDKILELESGQRYILTLLSTRIYNMGLTKKLGSQTYVYLKRLMDRGDVLRLGGRRGNYIVRNPLLRIIISQKVGYNKPYWYLAGFLYLIIKLFLSIDKEYAFETPTNTLYISPIKRIKRIDRYSVRLLDIIDNKYTIHLAFDEIGRINRIFPNDEDIKILVYPSTVTSSIARRMRSKRVIILDSKTLYQISKKLVFPRNI